MTIFHGMIQFKLAETNSVIWWRKCREAGTHSRTNHALRATGAAVLFQKSVPEKIIQETTGHRSLDALRRYEQVSFQQHEEVSRIICRVILNPQDKSWQQENQAFLNHLLLLWVAALEGFWECYQLHHRKPDYQCKCSYRAVNRRRVWQTN